MIFRAIALLGLLLACCPFLSAQSQPDKGTAKKDSTKAPPPPPDPALQIGGKGPEVYARLAKTSPDPSIREASFQTLSAFGPSARKYAGEAIVFGMTKDLDATVRIAALHAAQSVGLELESDIDTAHKAAVEMLSSNQIQVRYEAAVAIALIGPVIRKAALPRLIGIAHSENSWQLRKVVTAAIGKHGYDPDRGIPDSQALNALLANCHDNSYVVRKEAVTALLLVGRPLKLSDVQSVQAAMADRIARDADPGVKAWSRVVLVWYQGEKVKPTYPPLEDLVKMLRDTGSSDAVRYEAYHGLGSIGKIPGCKAQEIAQAVEQEKVDFVTATGVWTLGNLGSSAEGAIPMLERIARTHANPEVKQAALDAIAAIQKDKATAPTVPDRKDMKKP